MWLLFTMNSFSYVHPILIKLGRACDTFVIHSDTNRRCFKIKLEGYLTNRLCHLYKTFLLINQSQHLTTLGIIWLKAKFLFKPFWTCQSWALCRGLLTQPSNREAGEPCCEVRRSNALMFLQKEHNWGCETLCPFPSPSTSASFILLLLT